MNATTFLIRFAYREWTFLVDQMYLLCVNGSGLEIFSNKVHVRKPFCAGLDRGIVR